MKKIVYTDPETNQVVIVHPSPEWLAVKGNTLCKCAKLSIPRGCSYRVVEEDKIPQDRTFRDAWHDTGDVISHDMEKAKQIHLNRLKLIRNEKLQKLDKDYMLSIEHSQVDKAKQIVNKKQQLRDMPVKALLDMSGVGSVEELKEYTPDILKEI